MKAVALVPVLLAAMSCMTAAALAADPPKPKVETIRGRVTKVEQNGAKITLGTLTDGEDPKEIVIATNAKTKVTVDGKDAAIKDITVGVRVIAEVTDGVATKITARKATGGGASPAGPGAGPAGP
jgi:hypothetical protein